MDDIISGEFFRRSASADRLTMIRNWLQLREETGKTVLLKPGVPQYEGKLVR